MRHHALLGYAFGGDDVAGQGDFDGIAVAVQMPALAGMVGDAVAGVKFQPSCDLHDEKLLYDSV